MPRGRKPGSGKKGRRKPLDQTVQPLEVVDTQTVVIRRGFVHNKLPAELKNLRACLICSLVKMESEFEDMGCENCDRIIRRAAGQSLSFHQYTTANFQGLVATIYPKDSWVAKWQRLVHLRPGMYAVSVSGTFEPWLKDALADAGIPTKCF